MQGAARAIGWAFRRHHRWGLIALAVYGLILCAFKLFFFGPAHAIKLDPPNGLAGLVIGPVSLTFLYFVGVFSYGLAGDLAARQSIYPARQFTLPITNAALAGWPMLYGTVTVASLWLITGVILRWLGGADVPVVWPALLTAAYLAWTQAFMWLPYGLPGLRVIVSVLWLMAVDAAVLTAIHLHARESVMIAILAPQIPLAYALARVAVARARRGEVPDWRGWFVRRGAIAKSGSAARSRRFRSAARAQLWFEWRRHGRTLPAMVAIVVPVELVLLFIPGNNSAPVVFVTLAAVLVTPPVMAMFAASALSRPTPFTSTRPLTSVALIAAKLKMTVLSTLAAWSVALAATIVALEWSGTMAVVIERIDAGIDVTGTGRAIAVAVLVLAAVIASTWKRLVQSMCIGLSGRDWLTKASMGVTLAMVVALGPLVDALVTDATLQAAMWNGLPWILITLVGLKLCAGAWIAIRLYDSRLFSDRALVTGAACWLVTVGALYGVLGWFAASPLVPRYFLGAIAILLVPLARVAATPLALAWSRHQ